MKEAVHMTPTLAIEFLGEGYTIGVGSIVKIFKGRIIEERPFMNDIHGMPGVIILKDLPERSKKVNIEISSQTGHGKTRIAYAIEKFLNNYDFRVENRDTDVVAGLNYQFDGSSTEVVITTKTNNK